MFVIVAAIGAPLHAQSQQQGASPGWPCVGRPDPSIVAVSEASGGQLFLLDPSEIGSAATLMLAGDGHDELLRRVVGEMEPGTRTTDVHVDGSVERVLFSVSLQCLQAIEIERPSGAMVAAADPDVTWHAFQAGRLVGVRDPEPGSWKVRLAGKGVLFLVVEARAGLALESVRTVREGGRPGHEGLFDDDAPLVAGTTRLIELRVSRDLAGPQFELRGSDDAPVGALPPSRHASGGDEQVFLSEFQVPGVPFRVVVTGHDTAGNTVQRAQGTLFQVQPPR